MTKSGARTPRETRSVSEEDERRRSGFRPAARFSTEAPTTKSPRLEDLADASLDDDPTQTQLDALDERTPAPEELPTVEVHVDVAKMKSLLVEAGLPEANGAELPSYTYDESLDGDTVVEIRDSDVYEDETRPTIRAPKKPT